MIDKPSLKAILRLDGATCLAMAMAMVLSVFSTMIADLTAISETFLQMTGFILYPIGAFMLITAQRALPPDIAVRLILAGNILWIVASIALPVTGAITPNLPGWLLVAVQATAVAALTFAEARLHTATANRSSRILEVQQ